MALFKFRFLMPAAALVLSGTLSVATNASGAQIVGNSHVGGCHVRVVVHGPLTKRSIPHSGIRPGCAVDVIAHFSVPGEHARLPHVIYPKPISGSIPRPRKPNRALRPIRVLASPGAASCYYFIAFAFITADSGFDCMQTPGTRDNPNIGRFRALVNSTGARVWMHQFRDNSGWATCFDHGEAYELSGTREADPGNIQISTTTSNCPPTSAFTGIYTCLYEYPLAWSENLSIQHACYQATPPGETFNTEGQNFVFISNGTGYRLWLHQTNVSPHCYNNNNVYYVLETADETPDNIQVTGVSDPCP
jgi:hypothetical protein